MKMKTRYLVLAVIRMGLFFAAAIYCSLEIASASRPSVYTQVAIIAVLWVVFAWLAHITVREYRSIDDPMSAEQQRLVKIPLMVALTKRSPKQVKTSYVVQVAIGLCLWLVVVVVGSLRAVEASQISIYGRVAIVGLLWVTLAYFFYFEARYYRTKIDDDIRVRDEYFRNQEEEARTARKSSDQSKG
jgi:uncharacterized membrane protein